MTAKRTRASSWKCDERGLRAVIPTGERQIQILEITNEHVSYQYLGREFLYERIFSQARRAYEVHAVHLGDDLHQTLRLLAVSLMGARFAKFQPAWERKRPFIYFYDEKCRICVLGYGHLVMNWNGYRYVFEYDEEYDDVRVTQPNTAAGELPTLLKVQLCCFAREAWNALPPRFKTVFPGEPGYDAGMSMEGSMNGPRQLPNNPRARTLVLELQRLEAAGQDSHRISQELAALGKKGAEARKRRAALASSPKAKDMVPPESSRKVADMLGHDFEAPGTTLTRLNEEARAMAMERGDHLLPEDERPSGWEHRPEGWIDEAV